MTHQCVERAHILLSRPLHLTCLQICAECDTPIGPLLATSTGMDYPHAGHLLGMLTECEQHAHTLSMLHLSICNSCLNHLATEL